MRSAGFPTMLAKTPAAVEARTLFKKGDKLIFESFLFNSYSKYRQPPKRTHPYKAYLIIAD